jgi:hypothetical protein
MTINIVCRVIEWDEMTGNTRHLYVILRVPVTVKYHDCVSSSEIDPHPSCPGGQEEHEGSGIFVVTIDGLTGMVMRKWKRGSEERDVGR